MKDFTKKEIEEKSLDILHFLDLDIKKFNTPFSKQLEMVLKMYKYVVQNIHPVSNFGVPTDEVKRASSGTSEEKKQFAFEKLRQALTSNPGDTASNAILFNYLLYLKGYRSCIVLSESKNNRGEGHLSNLVELGKDDWYFFDLNLERINFMEDQFGNPEDFSYDWAGLGKDYYCKFYRPVSTIKEIGDPEVPISSYNVSDESILRELVASVGKGIPDLTHNSKLKNTGKQSGRPISETEREQ